jgi:hypothetical protein
MELAGIKEATRKERSKTRTFAPPLSFPREVLDAGKYQNHVLASRAQVKTTGDAGGFCLAGFTGRKEFVSFRAFLDFL